MVWLNAEGRLPLCEDGISGHLSKLKPCQSTISGFVTDLKKK